MESVAAADESLESSARTLAPADNIPRNSAGACRQNLAAPNWNTVGSGLYVTAGSAMGYNLNVGYSLVYNLTQCNCPSAYSYSSVSYHNPISCDPVSHTHSRLCHWT